MTLLDRLIAKNGGKKFGGHLDDPGLWGRIQARSNADFARFVAECRRNGDDLDDEDENVSARRDNFSKAQAAPLKRRKPARDPDGSLTAAEAAARFSITVEQLIGFVEDGALKGINVSRGKKRARWRFDPADLDAFKTARTTMMEQPCPSIDKKARRSTRSTSSSNVVGFLDQLEKRRSEKRGK